MTPSASQSQPYPNNGSGPIVYPSLPPGNSLPPSGDEWDLQGILAMLRRRWWATAGVAIATFSFIAFSTLMERPVFEGRFRLLVEPMTADALSNLDEQRGGEQANLDYDTQIQVLQNPRLISEVVEQVQKTYPAMNYATLVGGLSISRLQETKLLEVRYRGTDPAQIQTILQELSEAYLNYSANERQTNLRQGIQFIERQLPRSQEQVNQLQQDLQNLRQRNEFIDPGNLAGQVSGQIGGLSQQQLELEQNLAKARSRFSQLQGGAGATAALNDASNYQKLVGQLREIEAQIAIELTRFDEGSLNIRVLRERRENLLPLLAQEAERAVGSTLATAAVEIQTLEVQQQAIARQRAALDQRFQQLPALSRQYADLQQRLQIATDSLSRFLAARENLQIEAAQKEIPWEIVEPPLRSDTPISPNITRNLVLGSIASLALGVIAAWLLEQLDNTYRSPRELRDKTNLPLLGTIPLQRQSLFILESPEPSLLGRVTKLNALPQSDRAELVVAEELPLGDELPINSQFLEPWRVLYIKLQRVGTRRGIRSVVVSSALPGDGKTTVALNLAQAAVAMGQRVLLVDANLRQPQIHLGLDLPKFQGLSNILAEAHAPRHLVQQPNPHRDLFVLPAGDVTADPTLLLSSPKMPHLMAALHKAFHLVIYDTPPLEGLADTNLIAPHTDGVLLVATVGKTSRPAVVQAIDGLKTSQVPILGIVANQVKTT